MFSRQAVIDRWQQCLAESELFSAELPSRFSFYHRVRVRLYRFLLACYGSGDWRADEAAPNEAGELPLPSPMPLVETAGPLAGKPPKTGESIRTVLEHIHTANEGAASATSVAAGQPTWVAATARSAGLSPQRCCQLLRRRGGQARLVRRGDDVIVEVPRDDLDKALQLIARHREQLRIRDWRETSTTRVGVLVIATLAWMFAVWLAIALICSIATGKATGGELRPWLVVWLVVTLFCAGFHVWIVRRMQRQ
jgi:hypothetical protein